MAHDTGARLRRAWARHPLLTLFRHRRVVAFYRQLQACLKAGMGMPVALGEMARFAPDASTRVALEAVRRDLASGAGLAEALERHADHLDGVTVAMLSAGEEAGKLDEMLARALEHLEAVQRLRLSTAFLAAWPAYLIVAYVLVGPALRLGADLAAAGGQGSLVGLYVHGLAASLAWAVAIAVALFALPLVVATLGVEGACDAVVLRLPLLGPLARDLSGARFALALGAGIESGLEVVRSLALGVAAAGNRAIASRRPAAVAAVRSGSTLTDGIAALGVLDGQSLAEVSIGERTGQLPRALAQVAADRRAAALRRMRLVAVSAVAVVGGIVLVLIVSDMLGTIVGPVRDYYRTIDRFGADR